MALLEVEFELCRNLAHSPPSHILKTVLSTAYVVGRLMTESLDCDLPVKSRISV